MEENLDDDDVQIGYIMTRVGILRNTQEAVASYIDFVKRNLADESSFVVAAKVPDIQRKPATTVSLKERAGDTDVVFDSTVAHADIEEGEAYDKQIKPLPDLEKTSGAEKGPNVGATNTNKEKRKPKYPKVFDPTNPKSEKNEKEKKAKKEKEKEKKAKEKKAKEEKDKKAKEEEEKEKKEKKAKQEKEKENEKEKEKKEKEEEDKEKKEKLQNRRRRREGE
ncbi:protein PXR1-like [Solanum lycopersicum]|uniref:protein PXR1-like n=1 Tax=Solanum lycopersicum TaxID=4081 RepID=UPI003748ADED